jgi:lysyl-tRNA synthetase class 1
MHWADKIAKEIISSGKYKPYWIDDMKTPSGKIHVGSLRGTIIHDLIYKSLRDQGKKAKFTWVFDNHDPMDALPIYLKKEKWAKYLGQPLFKIPSPDNKAKNYAKYYADEFSEVFNKVGCKPKILWSSDFYLSGKMNEYVRLCLDKAEVIRKIYEDIYKKSLPKIWYPFQVVCPKCGKESTTKVINWDGEKVTYECKVNAVEWTKGCGAKGEISPFSDKDNFAGKLPWKVEWAVKWKIIGVTIEGAGKDHMTAGGSHDIAALISKKVLDCPVPYPIAYEHFLIGGKKMSSSKGLGSSAKEMSDVIPPYLLRFLFTRTDYRQAIDFDPRENVAIPDLFDEYDRCWKAYIQKSDEDLARTFELSQIGKVPEKKEIFLPRLRDIANYLQQPNINLEKKFTEIKGKPLEKNELGILKEREKYAKIWLEKYAPKDLKYEISAPSKITLTYAIKISKDFLKELIKIVEESKSPEELEGNIFSLIQKEKRLAKEVFPQLYTILINKPYGPKLAWLIWENKEKALARLKEASK